MKNKKEKLNKHKSYRKIILLISIFLFCYILTLKIFHQLNLNITNEEFLRNIINSSNNYMNSNIEKETIATKVISFLANVDPKNPVTFLTNNYIKTLSIQQIDNDALEDINELSKKSKYINDPYSKVNIQDPLVYIYNTHQLENYHQDNTELYNITPNVMMTSYILREKLKDLGIQSIVEETNIKQILNINNWNYAASYKVTEMLINDVKIKYPSIKYFIDIHRDSVKKQITTAQINDLSYAKIMFLIGLENPSYQNNLNLATNLNNLLEKHYPGISRGIYKKEGPGVNGIYNQHLSSNVMLIEFGGVDNDIYEVYNSVVAVANVLANYIGANNE